MVGIKHASSCIVKFTWNLLGMAYFPCLIRLWCFLFIMFTHRILISVNDRETSPTYKKLEPKYPIFKQEKYIAWSKIEARDPMNTLLKRCTQKVYGSFACEVKYLTPIVYSRFTMTIVRMNRPCTIAIRYLTPKAKLPYTVLVVCREVHILLLMLLLHTIKRGEGYTYCIGCLV